MSPDTAGSDAGQSMITFTFSGTGFVSRASRIHWLPSIEDDIDLASPDEIDNLERNVRRRLNGRVRDFRMLFQDNGLILQGCFHLSCQTAGPTRDHEGNPVADYIQRNRNRRF